VLHLHGSELRLQILELLAFLILERLLLHESLFHLLVGPWLLDRDHFGAV